MSGSVAFFRYGELGLAGFHTLLPVGAQVSNVVVPAVPAKGAVDVHGGLLPHYREAT